MNYKYFIFIPLLYSCSHKLEKKNSQDLSFPYTNPVVTDTIIEKEYVAEIEALHNVEIRSRIAGFIDKIHVDEGKFVQSGQLLFTINSQELKQELFRAEVQLKSATAEYKMAELERNNVQTLVEKNIVSKTEFELAKAKLDVAESKIKEAESNVSSIKLKISQSLIKAPFSGIINRLPLKTGSLIEQGTLLTTISNTQEVYAYFNLSEKEYLNMLKQKNKLKQNQVKLLMADGIEFPELGTVETSESEINKSTGNIAFRAKFRNPDNILKHGASGKILFPTTLKNAMLIPQKATFEVQENTYVMLIDEKGQVFLQKIQISNSLPHLFVVQYGLSKTDKLIVEGIQTLKEGDIIKPVFQPLSQILQTP